MNIRFAILFIGFLFNGLCFQPLAAQPDKKQKKESLHEVKGKLKVPGITLVTFPAEPTGSMGTAVPVLMGKSEIYFQAGELPVFKAGGGDEISFVWQQVDKKRLTGDAVSGGTGTVKYIVETDGKVKLADVSETPVEVPFAFTEEILKGISKLSYQKPAMVKGKQVRYVKKRSFTLLPPEPTELSSIDNYRGSDTSGRDKAVYMFVEQMPEFKGGDAGLQKFLADNVRYPQKARQAGIEGKVFVSFIVETDGRVTNQEIIKGLGNDLDEEVLRVARLLQFERPGKQNGRAVRVTYTCPVLFSLGKNK